MIRDASLLCVLSLSFSFLISCDKCDPPFFVYLSKEKLMMQRQTMLPFISGSFLQATKESGGGGTVERVAAASFCLINFS
jgi:hypothetical protein